MADFRKISIAFAAVALMLCFGLTANAQPNQITCTANQGGTPPTVRAEGYAELAQDILINCTSVNVPSNLVLNISIYGTTNLTSRILTSASKDASGAFLSSTNTNTTEATLLLNEPAVGSVALGTNAFRGTKVNDSQLSWSQIGIAPPGTNFTLRITNIRVNATQASPGVGLAGQINAFVTMSSNDVTKNAVTMSNSTSIIIALAQQSYSFSTGNKYGAQNSVTDSGQSYNQCSSVSGDLLSSDLTKTAGTDFSVSFVEKFATAFKTGGTPAGGAPPLYNGTANTENGYTASGLGPEAGYSTSPTRFLVRFSNIPAGVSVYVATNPGRASKADGTSVTTYNDVNGNPAAGGAATTPLAQQFSAQLIANTDTNGVGGQAVTTPDSLLAYNGKQNYGVSKLTVDANGNAMAVWEVVYSDPAVLETMVAPVIVKYSANVKNQTPATGTATVTGTLAPAYASGTGADVSKPGAVVPRFLETGTPSIKLFVIKACSTTLLFPYVTSFTGYDTGIAIANTSMDPFNSKNQNGGTCTLNFYNAGKVTKVTTKTVNTGETLAFNLTGGVPQDDGTFTSVSVSPNGYMIAQCNFLFAHGYAFISDLGIKNWAQGYLALVMGASSGTGRSDAPSASEALTGN